MTTLYQAIFETPDCTIFIDYEPAADGAIWVNNVTIQPRAKLVRYTGKARRGIVLSDNDEAAEQMQPYHRRELGRRTSNL